MPRTRWMLLTAGVLVLAVAVYVATRVAFTPRPRRVQLADGTVVLFGSDSSIAPAAGFPAPRTIRVNGDLYLDVPDSAQPLNVVSRLLRLTVNGKSALRITAYAHQSGEQVEVVAGDVVARKNYASNHTEPDHLTGGQMSMVNQTIDLMEKETFDPAEVRAWSKELGGTISR